MAKKTPAKNATSSTRNQPPAVPTAPRTFWGLQAEKWREVAAFCLASLALLLLLSLISRRRESLWVGAIGDAVARAATFLLGSGWVSYVLPALLLLAAVHAFRGTSAFHAPRKLVSGGLILLALCALHSLPHALSGEPESDELAFYGGGVVGSFIACSDGIGLAEQCGPIGAYVICVLLLLLGVMLSTDFLFVPLLHGAVRIAQARLTAWKRPPPVATLRFDREHTQRVFPAIGYPDKAASGTPGEDLLEMAKAPVIEPEEAEEMEEEAEAELEGSRLPSILPRGRRNRPKQELPNPPIHAMVQTELNFSGSQFTSPSLDLFSAPPATEDKMDREEVLEISGKLEQTLGDFGISARVVNVTQGPVVTLYEIQPAPGVKVSRILSLENDIALILRARSVRIQAPIPGKAAVGVEVPNRKVTPVYFRDLIASETFRRHKSPLAFTLGKTISGETVVADLAAMPHLLIAGTTGSGKSVCVNAIISSILFRMRPEQVKFIMVDPKRVELNVYSDIPHLLAPVVNEPRQAAAALMWAVQQMEERLEIFSKLRVRNIDSYNAVVTGDRSGPKGAETNDLKYLPHIVIIIDELADLMIIAKNEVEEFIVRLAQMSRAAGIHMIIATQRPSVNVLTGIIKANFPSRIAFRVSAKVDSRTILDMNGAETLLGRGDMLYSPGGAKATRVQGAFLADEDVEVLTEFLRGQTAAVYEQEEFSAAGLAGQAPGDQGDGAATAIDFGTADAPAGGESKAAPLEIPTEASLPAARKAAQFEFPSIQLKSETDEDEALYDKALRLVLETRKPSVSMIQRRLRIGFARAGRLMDLMEERAIVGPYLGSKLRDLIVDDPDALLQRLDEIENDDSL